MIFEIDIVSPFTGGRQLSGWEENAVKIAIENVTTGAFYEWMDAAKQGLNTTRQSYLSQMTMDVSGKMGEITLTGWLPMAIEFGQPLRDLKKTILEGGKPPKIGKEVKVTKLKGGGVFAGGVRYKRVPFRFAMSQETQHMPPLPPQVATMLRKSRTGGPLDLLNVHKTINRHTGYESKVGKFHNIRRTPGAGAHPWGRPTTFRTISDNSDPLSWFQEVKARDFREKALEYIRREAPNMMRAIFK